MYPSLFYTLRSCKLKACLEANKVPYLLPQSPSSHIGRVIHNIFAMAARGKIKDNEKFNVEWDNCIVQEERKMNASDLERHLLPLERHVQNYEVKKQQCLIAIAKFMTRKIPATGPITKRRGSETWLQTPDGLIGGYADAIILSNKGTIIRDYKTGLICRIKNEKSAILIDESYELQLKLYAGLYYSMYGTWPISLEIEHIDGTLCSISFSPEECMSLLKEACNLMDNVNTIVEKNNIETDIKMARLSSPSSNNCKFCLFRPYCSPYLKARKINPSLEWPNDIEGIIKDIRLLNNRLMLVKLTVHSGATVTVKDLHPQRYPNINNLDNIVIYSLLSGNDVDTYKEGLFTTIYRTD